MGSKNAFAIATIAGNCATDPKTRTVTTKNGEKVVCSLYIATDYGWGERRVTTFWNVEVWGKDGEFAAQDLKKGDFVTVTGPIYERKYESGGIEKKALQVEATSIAYERKKGEGGQTATQAPPPAAQSGGSNDPDAW